MIEYMGKDKENNEAWKDERGVIIVKAVSGFWETEDGFKLSNSDDKKYDAERKVAVEALIVKEAEDRKAAEAGAKAALETNSEEKLQCWMITHTDDFIEAILTIAEQRVFEILGRETVENPRGCISICPPDTDMSYLIKQRMAILAEKRAERNKKEAE